MDPRGRFWGFWGGPGTKAGEFIGNIFIVGLKEKGEMRIYIGSNGMWVCKAVDDVVKGLWTLFRKMRFSAVSYKRASKSFTEKSSSTSSKHKHHEQGSVCIYTVDVIFRDIRVGSKTAPNFLSLCLRNEIAFYLMTRDASVRWGEILNTNIRSSDEKYPLEKVFRWNFHEIQMKSRARWWWLIDDDFEPTTSQ